MTPNNQKPEKCPKCSRPMVAATSWLLCYECWIKINPYDTPTPLTKESAFEKWKSQGRTAEQIWAVENFLTGAGKDLEQKAYERGRREEREDVKMGIEGLAKDLENSMTGVIGHEELTDWNSGLKQGAAKIRAFLSAFQPKATDPDKGYVGSSEKGKYDCCWRSKTLGIPCIHDKAKEEIGKEFREMSRHWFHGTDISSIVESFLASLHSRYLEAFRQIVVDDDEVYESEAVRRARNRMKTSILAALEEETKRT